MRLWALVTCWKDSRRWLIVLHWKQNLQRKNSASRLGWIFLKEPNVVRDRIQKQTQRLSQDEIEGHCGTTHSSALCDTTTHHLAVFAPQFTNVGPAFRVKDTQQRRCLGGLLRPRVAKKETERRGTKQRARERERPKTFRWSTASSVGHEAGGAWRSFCFFFHTWSRQSVNKFIQYESKKKVYPGQTQQRALKNSNNKIAGIIYFKRRTWLIYYLEKQQKPILPRSTSDNTTKAKSFTRTLEGNYPPTPLSNWQHYQKSISNIHASF